VTEVLSVDKTAAIVDVGSVVKSADAVSMSVGLNMVNVSPKAALVVNFSWKPASFTAAVTALAVVSVPANGFGLAVMT
jgi:hypothetical protein